MKECNREKENRQLLSCMRLSKKRIGFLLNFNVPLMKDGITRRVTTS